MPVHVEKADFADFPYGSCPYYNDSSQHCCGREHDKAISDKGGLLDETIELKNPDGTGLIVGKYQLEPPNLMADSWVSRFRRSPQLEAYLRQTRRLQVSIRRQTGSRYVSTPIQEGCPIVSRLNKLAPSSE